MVHLRTFCQSFADMHAVLVTKCDTIAVINSSQFPFWAASQKLNGIFFSFQATYNGLNGMAWSWHEWVCKNQRWNRSLIHSLHHYWYNWHSVASCKLIFLTLANYWHFAWIQYVCRLFLSVHSGKIPGYQIHLNKWIKSPSVNITQYAVQSEALVSP